MIHGGAPFRSSNTPGVPASLGPYDLVMIGASFGGPKALETILEALPYYFPAPVVICQHITPGMTALWAERLNARFVVGVHEARNNVTLEQGNAYIAPAGLQMRVMRGLGDRPRIRLDADFSDSLHVPSVDILFSSAIQAYGSSVLAVLLTGLGSDGASGMLTARQAGAYTIAESAESAASYSMPGSATALGAVVEELPLNRIPQRIIELATRHGRVR
jgi:two-component system chemotaxis response regulator CheB